MCSQRTYISFMLVQKISKRYLKYWLFVKKCSWSILCFWKCSGLNGLIGLNWFLLKIITFCFKNWVLQIGHLHHLPQNFDLMSQNMHDFTLNYANDWKKVISVSADLLIDMPLQYYQLIMPRSGQLHLYEARFLPQDRVCAWLIPGIHSISSQIFIHTCDK